MLRFVPNVKHTLSNRFTSKTLRPTTTNTKGEAVDQFPFQITLKNLHGREISTKKKNRKTAQLDLYDGSSELTSTTKLLFFFQ